MTKKEEEKDEEEIEDKKELEDDEEQSPDDEENTSGSKPKKTISKKLVIIVLIALIILSALGVGGFLYYRNTHAKMAASQNSQTSGALPHVLFYNFDDIVTNLESPDGQPRFIKIGITLQVSNENTIYAINARLPILKSALQTYFHELRPDDLNGSAGIYRIREDLLLRFNEMLEPYKVNDILFRDVLIQ